MSADRQPNASEQQITAGRQVFAGILADEVAKLSKAVRAELEPHVEPDTAVAAKLPDGTRIGKVARSKPSTTARVTDERALLAWVKRNHPSEILTVESVNSAYLSKLLGLAKQNGVAYDTATGEVIPGVEQTTGSAAYRPTATDEGRELVLGRLSELIGDGLLALPTAEDTP